LSAQGGGEEFRDGEPLQDEIGVDRNSAGSGNRYNGTKDDQEAEDLVMGLSSATKRNRKTRESCKRGITSMMGATASAEYRKPCAAATKMPE
jgi:hypothetical protein